MNYNKCHIYFILYYIISIYALTPLFLIGLRVIFCGYLKSVPLKLRIVCLPHYIKIKGSTKFDSQKDFFTAL